MGKDDVEIPAYCQVQTERVAVMSRQVEDLHDMVTGNGDPDKGLLGRMGVVEEAAKGTRRLCAVLVGLLLVVLGGIFGLYGVILTTAFAR